MCNVVEANNLNLQIGNFKLQNASFKINKGSIVALVGNNGAGKSVLIKGLLNIIALKKGEIKFWNENLLGKEKEIKERIGCVFDDGYFYEQLTLAEMSKIVSAGYKQWDHLSFINYIKDFELNLNQEINQLSKGMKMKFALAIALSHSADLLIMDEPTAGLDVVFRKKILKILLDYVQKNKGTILFSTHLATDVEKIADCILVLKNGRIIYTGSRTRFEKKCFKKKSLRKIRILYQ